MPTTNEFTRKLLGRLQTRASKDENGKAIEVYVLDFRHRDFAALGRNTQMLRDPHTIGWPEEGRPTTDESEAKRWVQRDYARLIERELDKNQAVAAAVGRQMTVAEACDAYLERESSVDGCSQHTIRNRRSAVEAHVRPLLGHLPLGSLDKKIVRTFLERIQVWKTSPDGDWRLQPASYGYKRALRACLRAVWRSNVPDVDPPFEGTILKGESKSRERRLAAHAGQFEQLFERRSGAQTAAELRRTLIAAAWYDRERIASRPNTSRWAVANTVEAIAFEAAEGVRAEELVLLRWSCIDEEHEILLVPGTKSAAAVRILPLQRALLPWIERMKARIRPKNAAADWRPDPRAFVFITNPRQRNRMGSVRSLTNRIAAALQLAGTKRPGKAQHGLRATFASQLKSKLSAAELKQYLGHEDAFGGATDVYVEPRVDDIPSEHRALVTYLPTPEEIETESVTFVPPRRQNEKPGRRKRPRKGGHYRVDGPDQASA